MYHPIEGAQNQKNKNWWIRHKWPCLMNTYNPKYQQKSIPICSPQQNYLSLFAMRYVLANMYPVQKKWGKKYTSRGLYLHAYGVVQNTILFIHLITWKIFKERYILNDILCFCLFVCFLCIISFLAKCFRYFEFLFNNHAISTTAPIKVCSVLIPDLELKDKKSIS